MTDPKQLQEQLDLYAEEKKLLMGQSPKKDELRIGLRAIEQEERRYVKAWGQGTMSEVVYTDQMNSVARRRKELQDLLNKPEEDKLAHQLRNIDLESSVEPFKQYLANLEYEDKLFTVRKIVDKVVATKEKVTICGKIPAYASSLSVNRVGLNAKHWYSYFSNQPFELTFPLPEHDDKRTRGYSSNYIKSLTEKDKV